MHFAHPMALWLLTLLAPLILLHVLKVKRRRRSVGSTWLWEQAERDLRAARPFRRLIVRLPFVLQALALVAIAVAAAGPHRPGPGFAGERIALVLDASASMLAVDAPTGRPRIDLARQRAHDLLDQLSPDAEVSIYVAGAQAQVALAASRDRRAAHQVVASVRARPQTGDLNPALHLALARLRAHGGRGRVVAITDGHLATPLEQPRRARPVDFWVVGDDVTNAAIVHVDIRLGLDPVAEREQVQAFLSVANFGPESRELYVTMRQQNASDTLASRRVQVGANETVPVVLRFFPERGDYGQGLIFELSPHDWLDVDDRAYGRVPRGRRVPVFIATDAPPSPWFVRAAVADPDAEVRTGTVAQLLAAAVGHDSLVVVDGACPASAPGRNLVVLNPPVGTCFGIQVREAVEAPHITTWRRDDLRLRFTNFDELFVERARPLSLASERQALVRSDRGVLLADASTEGRRITVIGFTPGASNWPLSPSFVVFVANLIEETRHARRLGHEGPTRSGAPLRISVPLGVGEVEWTTPAGETSLHVAADGLTVIPDVGQLGLFRAGWEGANPGSTRIAINLASAAESDLLEQLDPTAFPRDESGVALADAGPPVKTWGWLLALVALAVLVLEVAYTARRLG